MRRAVPNNQLSLYYQVQLSSDLRPLGAEALIRWTHPVRGIVSPAQFIPIAEEISLILEIGHWVLETACKQLSLWSKRKQTSNLTLAVNVSALQFRRHDFVDMVKTMVNIHQINPNLLKIELTESVVLSDVSDVITKMHALKAVGISLSLDDFGTGYSSLSYLKQLPLDQIKIDQSFVRDVINDLSDAIMVKTIINLAHSFSMNVIAEGVETDAQLNFLKQNGCMAYQGYLFSKPIPIEEFEVLLGTMDCW
jgi:EAL domain-containing protein (putative c-di-GMP-specific phosphodiesterase class I)